MKGIVDASKQLLGAALLGIGGDEVVQALLDVMYADAPYTVIQEAMHIHPTVYEMIPYMDLEPLGDSGTAGANRRPDRPAARPSMIPGYPRSCGTAFP